MNKIVLFVLLCAPTLTFGQKIQINTRPPYIGGREFSFTIVRKNDQISLDYKLLEKVDPKLINNYATADYKKIMAFMNQKNVVSKEVIKELKRIDSIKKPYSTYRTKKILITPNNQPDYFKMLAQFLNTPETELEKSTEPKFFIDKGTWFYFTVLKDGSTKNYYVNSPKAIFQPILTKLVEDTINLLPTEERNWFKD